jgi:4-hydroxybenzoate polyprenyltransferase
MKTTKRRVPEKHATWIVLAMAIAVLIAASLAFLPMSFPWLAWGALGYFAIVTGWREFFVVDRGSKAGSRTDSTSAVWAISAGWIVAISIGILGFFEIVSMRNLVLGLAAIFVLIMLWRQTAGGRG